MISLESVDTNLNESKRPDMLLCAKCDTQKPTLEFHVDNARLSGRRFACKACSNVAKRKWQTSNLERNRANSKNNYWRHRDIYVAKMHAKYHADPAKMRQKAKDIRRRDPVGAMLARTKAGAKARGLEFALTREDIMIPGVCPVFGIPLFKGDHGPGPNSPSIVRRDNDIGYLPDNIVIVSNRANMLKKDATVEELRMLAAFYAQPSKG